MVTVGRVVRPHGIRGQIVVAVETDYGDERFEVGAVVFLLRDGTPRACRVAASREQAGRRVIALEGVATRDDAERLRGAELRIPAAAVRPLAPGRYYVHALVGCRVETVAGDAVGVVEDVQLGTGTPLLVVAGGAGEVLVPLAERICREVDVAAGRIVVDPPDGLVELNRRAARGGTGAGGGGTAV